MKQKRRHIGIVGVTAEGAALCYKTIVSLAAERLGPRRHPEITLNNVSYDLVYQAQAKGDNEKMADILAGSVDKLRLAGSDFAIIPANSVHLAYDLIAEKSSLPLLNLVGAVADECLRRKFRKAGVMGIGLTMSGELYRKPLEQRGIAYGVPDKESRERINDIIFREIVTGQVSNKSIKELINIINNLKRDQFDAVILGCTELPLVINEKNSPLPVIDSTRLLARKALEYSLKI